MDPAELNALETEIGHPLPSEYRAFIQEANGGTMAYDVLVPPDKGEIIGFTELFHIGRNEQGEYGYGTLIGEYRRRNSLWLSEHVSMERLLPIARDGGNDILFLDLDAANVVAFVHGLPEWTGRTQQNILAIVGDTFDAYLDSLFISDETTELNWEDAQDAGPDDPWRQAVEY
ncbi:SMI1/KNR4 family protein [Kibdelosporangium philippinense]|uniref:SMI1/KNR4 family protein n=1 Tax=Kibdelosporangium philippinense TaxID=211113 RepID=UPI0027DEC854|nr:SMI1/KNR4 family protein [Kibdelosporangium philippinense]